MSAINADSVREGRRALLLWVIRVLSLGAVLVTFYLMMVTAEEGAAPAGCGPNGGCAAVLTSHWGKWFHTPVAKPALVLYGAMLAASIFAGATQPAKRRLGAWFILILTATLAGAAGLWFILLQAFIIKSFCAWCTTLHGTGITIAVLAWIAVPLRSRSGTPPSPAADASRIPRRAAIVAAVTVAMVGVGILIAGQVGAPITKHSDVVLFGGGTLPIDVSQQPILGSMEAPHRLLLMNDYTCIHCRELHHNLDAARERYGEQLSLVIVPVPLNSACNASISRTHPDQRYACDLAKLALAVWRADPKKFPAYDKWLYEPEKPPEPETARRFAADLVGEAALAKAQADPWVSETLQRDISLYRTMGMGKLPKLVLQQTSADRATRNQSRGELYDILERDLNLKPLSTTRAQ